MFTGFEARLLSDDCKDTADLWLINTCTVKGPSEAAMSSTLRDGRQKGKALVVAGCVPQGDKRKKELEDLSIVGKRRRKPNDSAHQCSCAFNWLRTLSIFLIWNSIGKINVGNLKIPIMNLLNSRS